VKQMRAALHGSPLRVWLLMWVLRNASVTVRQRENLRFERTRLFGRVRRIFREAGKRLHAMGVLEIGRISSISRWRRFGATWPQQRHCGLEASCGAAKSRIPAVS
jgi:hypothetical protein